jgi:hypothetical protein
MTCNICGSVAEPPKHQSESMAEPRPVMLITCGAANQASKQIMAEAGPVMLVGPWRSPASSITDS